MKQFNRKSPRATWHKYNGGEYFITICTKNRIHYFGEIVDGETLNWKTPKRYKKEMSKYLYMLLCQIMFILL